MPKSDMRLHVSVPDGEIGNRPNRIDVFPRTRIARRASMLFPDLHFRAVRTGNDASPIPEVKHGLIPSGIREPVRRNVTSVGGILKATRPLVVYPRRNTQRDILCAGAETRMRIAEAVPVARDEFPREGTIEECRRIDASD